MHVYDLRFLRDTHILTELLFIEVLKTELIHLAMPQKTNFTFCFNFNNSQIHPNKRIESIISWISSWVRLLIITAWLLNQVYESEVEHYHKFFWSSDSYAPSFRAEVLLLTIYFISISVVNYFFNYYCYIAYILPIHYGFLIFFGIIKKWIKHILTNEHFIICVYK